MDRPLSHLRVLDLSRHLAGPTCGMLLGDLGADVIKVERPGTGDETRKWGPPFIGGESAYFLCCNRNKRSITLDLKSTEGQGVARSLAERCDVLIENFRVGGTDAFGLGYEQLRATNPRFVLVSITPYGQTGLYRDFAATDLTLFASGGAMYREGLPGREPMNYAGHMPRTFPGSVPAALFRRRTTDRVDWLDLSEVDCWASHPNQIARRLAYTFSGDLEPREDTKASATATTAGFGRGTYH